MTANKHCNIYQQSKRKEVRDKDMKKCLGLSHRRYIFKK